MEKSCRLEGLLDTVINRGKDLQKELEENTRIEESLRRQIEAELQLVPNHPVVSEAPRIEDLSPSNSGDAGEPTTPRASNDPYLPMPGGGSPYKSEFILTGRPTDLRDYENRIFPFSPSSIDNSDLCGPGLPGYRGSGRGAAAFEETTSYDYGCGAVLFAPTPLFHHSNNAMIEGGGALGGAGAGAGIHRVRSNSTDNHPGLGPSALSSSFDTIDFRTGMSGHRGLTNSKLNPGHSPTPRGSQLRMSEHRGIGRVRGPLQRSSASNSPS